MKILDNIENPIAKNLLIAFIKFIGILSIAFICFIIMNRLGLSPF